MALRRLIEKDADCVDLKLLQGQAVLIFDYIDGHTDYVLLTEFSREEKFFETLEDIDSFRFVGDEVVFNQLESIQYDWFDSCSKRVLFTTDMDLFYYPGDGRISFDKSQAKMIEDLRQKIKTSAITRSSMGKKKVLIVDDSRTIQKILQRILSKSEKLEVMAVAKCPSEARAIIEQDKPDLITLDIHMPEMNGVEFLKSYLEPLEIPVVMISSVSIGEGPLVLEALSHGAQTYIQKPDMSEIKEIEGEIIEKLEEIACKEITPRMSSLGRIKSAKFSHLDGLIAIGSSTGGTQALQHILTSFPDEIPPVLITQHIPAVFSKALADRLDELCKFKVKEAEHGEAVVPNTVYIAPGEQQFKISNKGQQLKVVITDDPPVNRFKPSVDYLFDAISGLDIDNVVAAVLTGMGKDGAKGLLQLRQVGAKTIAQDKATSTVYGMPREAFKIGAVDETTPLHKIVEQMIVLFNKKNGSRAA